VLTEHELQDEIVEATVPVVIEFFSPQCSPCRTVETHLEEIAAELGGQIRLGKFDISEDSTLIERYRVETAPTVVVFVEGADTRRIVGARPKQHLTRLISAYLTSPEHR
jgi:thioredoxin 1